MLKPSQSISLVLIEICQKKEAFAFSSEKWSAMEPTFIAEELFKAGCAMGTKKYIDIKEVVG